MNKVLVIIRREYLVRVRTRAFVIGTILSPVLMLALIILPGFLATRGGGDRKVTVLDQSGDPELFSKIKDRLENTGPDADSAAPRGMGGTRFLLTQKVVPPTDDLKRAIDDLRKDVGDQAFVVLPPGVLDNAQPEYYAKNTADFSINALEQAISGAISERRLARDNLPADKIRGYMRHVDLKTNKIDASGEIREGGRADFLIAFVLLFFIYMSVLIYGLFVMRGVIEEKQSRIMEVIVSSVRPTQMMLGKVIGIGLVGLTQIAIWALTALVLSVFGISYFAARGIALPSIPVSLLFYFVLFFVLGFFLYATLYAMVGAMVSSEEEAQQAQIPVTLLIVVPMMIFTMIMANPNSSTSVALSMVPFFAPTLMILRIAVVNPPAWQVALSIAIMVATILACVWVAARIYRVGILMYGKRPSLAELGRWLRYS